MAYRKAFFVLPIVFSIGGVAFHSYGLAIACGVMITYFLAARDVRVRQLWYVQESIFIALIAGALIGGRLFYWLSNYGFLLDSHIVAFWDGGFSIVGSIVGGYLGSLLLASWYRINRVALLDAVAIYAPLVQAIARIGCWCAGCCYGIPTTVSWRVLSVDGVLVHPTQIYSALLLFLLFGLLYSRIFDGSATGLRAGVYLIGAGTERFFIDFLRQERSFCWVSEIFSCSQIGSFLIVLVGVAFFARLRCFASKALQRGV